MTKFQISVVFHMGVIATVDQKFIEPKEAEHIASELSKSADISHANVEMFETSKPIGTWMNGVASCQETSK